MVPGEVRGSAPPTLMGKEAAEGVVAILLTVGTLCSGTEPKVAFSLESSGKSGQARLLRKVLGAGASEGKNNGREFLLGALVGECKPAWRACEGKSSVVGGELLGNVFQ